jgi:hypothetical protein
MDDIAEASIPWLSARAFAGDLQVELRATRGKLRDARQQLETLGALSVAELQSLNATLKSEVASQRAVLDGERAKAEAEVANAKHQVAEAQATVVATEEIRLLQESGIYRYRHPLTDVVAYEQRLASIEERKKQMNLKDGGAVFGSTGWTVNGSLAAGRAMVRDFSKLMLRAFNAEADNLVRGLKPYKLDGAIERLNKVAETIVKLGKTMDIQISEPYRRLRVEELELTADYLAKQAEQKEAERLERERLREEKKVQQEIERERERLEKEQRHYQNALQAVQANGDPAAIERIQAQLVDVQKAIDQVDYRAANIRAGYVYLISNIGSFGEKMVKVGMTRRLDPLDRIRELSDASVPFNFDVHALFFSDDAVGIETKMHDALAHARVNMVNRRREFFRVSPLEVKAHLSELAGELLKFEELPEALEYRQSLTLITPV